MVVPGRRNQLGPQCDSTRANGGSDENYCGYKFPTHYRRCDSNEASARYDPAEQSVTTTRTGRSSLSTGNGNHRPEGWALQRGACRERRHGGIERRTSAAERDLQPAACVACLRRHRREVSHRARCRKKSRNASGLSGGGGWDSLRGGCQLIQRGGDARRKGISERHRHASDRRKLEGYMTRPHGGGWNVEG